MKELPVFGPMKKSQERKATKARPYHDHYQVIHVEGEDDSWISDSWTQQEDTVG